MSFNPSHKMSFLLGVATGATLTHPELKKAVKPAFRWAVRETVRLKAKFEQLAAYSSEEWEDLVAEAKAEASESESTAAEKAEANAKPNGVVSASPSAKTEN